MRTVSTENRQKFDVLVLHELFGLECVCAIRGSLHAVVLEGKMSYSRGSVIDTHFRGGLFTLSSKLIVRTQRQTIAIVFFLLYLNVG